MCIDHGSANIALLLKIQKNLFDKNGEFVNNML